MFILLLLLFKLVFTEVFPYQLTFIGLFTGCDYREGCHEVPGNSSGLCCGINSCSNLARNLMERNLVTTNQSEWLMIRISNENCNIKDLIYDEKIYDENIKDEKIKDEKIYDNKNCIGLFTIYEGCNDASSKCETTMPGKVCDGMATCLENGYSYLSDRNHGWIMLIIDSCH